MDDQATVVLDPAELEALIDAGDGPALGAYLGGLGGLDDVNLISRLDAARRVRMLTLLDAEFAAGLVRSLPDPLVVEALGAIDADAGAAILEELPSDERADLLGTLDVERAAAILDRLSIASAADARLLGAYPDDVAGGLMVTEFLRYPRSTTVAQVVEDLGTNAERYSKYDIQYAYVTDPHGRLAGVLRMRDLLLIDRSRRLSDMMIRDPLSVRDDVSLDGLLALFEEHGFFGIPVVDAERGLVGVVQRSAVEAAAAADADRVYRRTQGIVGGEELRSMPILLRSRRRLSWLSVNIVLNIVAASVIAMHTDTLEAVIALAVFLPIISDMSGCSGNQAVAVSMRELTLGVVRPSEVRRVIAGEALLGAINGLALGLLIGLVAVLWKGDPDLGLVVGGALMLNTVVAVIIGGAVPLVLKRLGVDPALASGPILTTVTDMCGFFIVLTFASLMLSRLT
jgi:magnesium transporter